MSVNDVDPSILFGGTWKRIKDKFLLCSGDTYTLGSEGGESEHTLIVNEIPSHNHTLTFKAGASTSVNNYYAASATTNTSSSSTAYVNNTGGSKPHNNMPPYLTVNVWVRVNPTQ